MKDREAFWVIKILRDLIKQVRPVKQASDYLL